MSDARTPVHSGYQGQTQQSRCSRTPARAEKKYSCATLSTGLQKPETKSSCHDACIFLSHVFYWGRRRISLNSSNAVFPGIGSCVILTSANDFSIGCFEVESIIVDCVLTIVSIVIGCIDLYRGNTIIARLL